MKKLVRILRHQWLDGTDTRRAVPDDLAERLARRVAASEAKHTGEVRICVEVALPFTDLWGISDQNPLSHVVRERALSWFGKLRVWDTEQNNGVLIYLLLAEHAIEFVADRAVARSVNSAQWQAIVDRLAHHLHGGAFEDGLTQALEEVTALLIEHFPAHAAAPQDNELPNCVVRC